MVSEKNGVSAKRCPHQSSGHSEYTAGWAAKAVPSVRSNSPGEPPRESQWVFHYRWGDRRTDPFLRFRCAAMALKETVSGGFPLHEPGAGFGSGGAERYAAGRQGFAYAAVCLPAEQSERFGPE